METDRFRGLSKPPHELNILFVKRTFSPDVDALTCALLLWLNKTYNLISFVEAVHAKEYLLLGVDCTRTFNISRDRIDLLIVIGGDGTTLWATSMFSGYEIPLILSIGMGTLSYMCQVKCINVMTILKSILENVQPTNVIIQKRSLLSVLLNDSNKGISSKYIAVNECIIDRGAFSNLCKLDVYVNDVFFTTIAADGLLLATPTGSTAYSMAAGGSVVHPQVDCILFTPVCPHSLNMRPIILPPSKHIQIRLSAESRTNAKIRVDGRPVSDLSGKGQLTITQNEYSLRLLTLDNDSDLWLTSLREKLFWGLSTSSRLNPPIAADISSLLQHNIPSDLRTWLEMNIPQP